MDFDLLKLIQDNPEVIKIDNNFTFNANSIESFALAILSSYQKNNRSLAVCLPSLYDAQHFLEFASNFLNVEEICYFPYDEVVRADAIYSSKEFVKERQYTLYRLVSKKKSLVVFSGISLCKPISSPSCFSNSVLHLKKSESFEPKKLIEYLIKHNYSRVNRVEGVFEFSARGEIVDVFTPSYNNPVRFEYFDDEIEDIRIFNTKSELSFEKIDEIDIIPANEVILSEGEIDRGVFNISQELNRLDNSELNQELLSKTSRFLAEVKVSGLADTTSKYLPYFEIDPSFITSYLKDIPLYFYRFEDVYSIASNYEKESADYYAELKKERMALSGEKGAYSLEDSLKEKRDYICSIDEDSQLQVTSIPYRSVSMIDSLNLINNLKRDGYTPYVFLSSAQLEGFKRYLDQEGVNIDLSLSSNGINVVLDKSFSRGFLLPKAKLALVSSKEIYGFGDASATFLNRFKEAKTISKYQDLEVGDYVVHQEQGIGVYLGIKEIDGLEYLTIGYAGDGQKLYVPLEKYKMIRKYASKEGVKPRLDYLGGASWARRKAKIRGRVSYLADKLIEIEAQRNTTPGFAFQPDDELEQEFSDAFPYPLTTSQQAAWEEIKKDMMSSHPMDRLLTGDVGFGKTEVAFKAIFKCICSHKQAALLCPTTVLCKQHYDVAIERFKSFDVRIAMLNRNVSVKETNSILRRLKDGEIDLLIGTHRILSDDIQFKDLGLLVVDEEQRFGVAHKEKIKTMTTNIDVLTLTATPIPRTLQMSLLNVRSLSRLDNPPYNRLPIKTYVVKFNKKLIKEVIDRELGRKGQVYYLHNRIQSLPKTISELEEMFPYANIKGVHGQMDGNDISDIMSDFYEGKIDILVCTSIVETGLDVPNCNTIIVEKAENFGLAQLYQIKGRVGRSSRLAYAYLTYPDIRVLNDESKKRLKALKEFTELGSGYRIANEDLNIRGAGDILGKEQAGFIDSIGYDAYMQLLQEVMKEKKVILDNVKDLDKSTRYEISFSLDAHIPSTYASESDRINIYREMFDISSLKELQEYQKKVEDIYGRIPYEMSNLFVKKTIEIYLDNPIFSEFKEYIDHYEIKMSEDFSSSRMMARELEKNEFIADEKKIYVRFLGKSFRFNLNKSADYLMDLFNLVTSLIAIKNKVDKRSRI